jgi:hypothetical protein
MGETGKTVLVFAGVAAVGLFAWAYWKSKQPGSSGGVLHTIGGIIPWANSVADGVTSSITGNARKAGSTVEAGVKGADSIISDTATTARHVLTFGLW